jgi:hypothetical protein
MVTWSSRYENGAQSTNLNSHPSEKYADSADIAYDLNCSVCMQLHFLQLYNDMPPLVDTVYANK